MADRKGTIHVERRPAAAFRRAVRCGATVGHDATTSRPAAGRHRAIRRPPGRTCQQGASVLYRPALLGQAKLHFAQAATGVDVLAGCRTLALADRDAVPARNLGQGGGSGETNRISKRSRRRAPSSRRCPASCSRPKRYSELATALKDSLYRNRKLQAVEVPGAQADIGTPDESEADFRVAPVASWPARSATSRSRSCGRSTPRRSPRSRSEFARPRSRSRRRSRRPTNRR